jgi:hypothetical protein
MARASHISQHAPHVQGDPTFRLVVPQVERMQVVLRVRPPKGAAAVARRDVAPGDSECLHALSGTSVHIAPPDGSAGCKAGDRPATFSFSRVFAPDADQEYLFRHTARNLVRLPSFLPSLSTPLQLSVSLNFELFRSLSYHPKLGRFEARSKRL